VRMIRDADGDGYAGSTVTWLRALTAVGQAQSERKNAGVDRFVIFSKFLACRSPARLLRLRSYPASGFLARRACLFTCAES